MKKKFISRLLAFSFAFNLALIPASNLDGIKQYTQTIVYAANSESLPDQTKDGVILHAFDWSFNTIKNELPNIKEAGYKSIQVSPIQGTKSSSKNASDWWLLYQPTNQSIGNSQLGSYDDFKALCDEADKYGISIIVDVVMNHMANNGEGQEDKISDSVDSAFKDSSFYHNLGQCHNWNNRYDVTQRGIGMPDLNTQNPAVQNKAIEFLNQCVDAGADGFRFDAAKHIETDKGLDSNQSWAGNYWNNVLGNLHNKSDLFIYGEILQDGTVDNVSAYEELMNVTASNYGYSVRDAVKSTNLSSMGTGFGGVDSNKAVDFVETHDTYQDGTSKNLSDTQRKLGWAIAASRANSVPLFFDRPTSSIGNEGESLWKDKDVSAVNKFHNAMAGQNEYIRYTNNNQTMLIDRGTKGTVIINDGYSNYVNSPTNLADGTYKNHGSADCTLTVSNGTISGNIPANSVVVLYGETDPNPNPGPTNPTNPTNPTTDSKVNYDSSKLVQGKELTISYNGSLANSNSVSLHWGCNSWTNVSDVPMTKDANGTWKATITIPSYANSLNFAFTNGSNWDNNDNKNWTVPVWSNSAPITISPAPTAGKSVKVTYNGSLASNSSSITLHWGNNSWSTTNDTQMTKNDDGTWSANINIPANSYMLNMCFKNNSNNWDSNNSNNYNYSVAK